jgi:hypothetical protein
MYCTSAKEQLSSNHEKTTYKANSLPDMPEPEVMDLGPYSQNPRNFVTTQIFCQCMGPNNRFAWSQSCKGFVNMVPGILSTLECLELGSDVQVDSRID